MGDCRPTRTLVPQWVTPCRAPWGSWHAAQEDPAAPPAAPGVSPRFGAPGKDVPSRPPPPSFLPFVAVCAGCWPSQEPDGGFGNVSSSSCRQSPFLCRSPPWMKTSLSDLPQAGPPPGQGQPCPYATMLRLLLTPAQRSLLHPNHMHRTGRSGMRGISPCVCAWLHLPTLLPWGTGRDGDAAMASPGCGVCAPTPPRSRKCRAGEGRGTKNK